MIQKKIIACDIDGCLNDQVGKLREIVLRDFNVSVSNKFYDPLGAAGFNEKEKEDFWNKYGKEMDTMNVVEDVAKVLKKYKDIGFKIIIITARPYHVARVTERWLSKHNIEYDELLVNAGNKIGACNWKQIGIMIEDSPSNIRALIDGGVRVLMPVHGYNEEIIHPNVIPCLNWEDIDKSIADFFRA